MSIRSRLTIELCNQKRYCTKRHSALSRQKLKAKNFPLDRSSQNRFDHFPLPMRLLWHRTLITYIQSMLES